MHKRTMAGNLRHVASPSRKFRTFGKVTHSVCFLELLQPAKPSNNLIPRQKCRTIGIEGVERRKPPLRRTFDTTVIYRIHMNISYDVRQIFIALNLSSFKIADK